MRSRLSLLTVLAVLPIFAVFTLAGCQTAPSVEPADLVLRGGLVTTMDAARPEAEAIAVVGDRIVAVGSDEEIGAYVGPATEVIEIAGRRAIPGFIEGHGHFIGLGFSRMQLDLTTVESWDEAVAMVEEAVAAAEPGTWIQGRGWHQEKWASAPEPNVDGLPYHHSLSAVSPDNPVVLRHASGHAAFANAAAMELGGVTRDTPDPEGGEIIKSPDGEPIGVFRETAQGLVSRREPPTEAELLKAIELATDECLAKGITSFQDAGTPLEQIDLLIREAEAGNLRIRLWMMIRDDPAKLETAFPGYNVVGVGGNFLTVGGIKHSIDGALGAHGAWLLEPYTDMPSSTGLNTVPIPVIERSAEIAIEHGLQLCVHAIGDRANRETLDLFERAFAKLPADGPTGAARRWRIEHAQHLHPDDIPRFAELGVIASMQGVHCTSDGPWVPQRIGEERSEDGAYVWRKLLESGAVVTNGTDAPVEDVSPIASFHSSVTRLMANGERFYPEQVMTREEALASYTRDTAYAAFEEFKGTLAPGKLADVTVLTRDILTVPAEEIPGTEIAYTIVGGEVAYAADAGTDG